MSSNVNPLQSVNQALQATADKARSEERRVKSILFDMLYPDMAETSNAEFKQRILDLEHQVDQLTATITYQKGRIELLKASTDSRGNH